MKSIISTFMLLCFLPQVCLSSEIYISYSEYKPFMYKKNDGSLTGLDYDILSGFCNIYGYDCVFEDTSFNNVLKNIWEGTADMGAGAIYKTFERGANGLFTSSYLKTGLVAVVPYNFNGDLESLYSRTVGVKKNATGHKYATKMQEKYNSLNVLYYENTIDSFRALELGYVDWLLNDYYNSLDIIYSRFRGSFKILALDKNPLFLENSEIAYYLPFKNKELKSELDNYITSISRSGELSRLVDKWFYITKPVSLRDYIKYIIILAVILTAIIFLTILVFIVYRNQKKLKQHNRFLETILNIPSAMIFTTDENFKISYWNSGCREITGFARSDIAGVDELFDSEKIPLNGNKVENFITEIKSKSGTKSVLFDIYKISRLKDRYLFFGLDVSETLDAINAKMLYEHLYLSIVENSPNGIMTIEGQNIIINNPLKRWMNTDKSFIKLDDLPQTVKKLIVDFKNTDKDRSSLRDVQIFPDKYTDIFINKIEVNDKTYIILFFQDITEKHRTSKLMAEVQKNEAVSNIVNSVVHDMNNILGVITNYASLLKRQNPENVIAEKISKMSQESGSFLRSLLTLGKKNNEPKVIYIDNFLEGRFEFLKQLSGFNINFELKIINRGGEISAVEERFYQLLINLIMNAKDATPPGGTISITKDFSNDIISIKVADTGTGIPDEFLNKIFEPFFTTKGEKGTGLGLYASRILVEETGGEIKVYPNTPKGTVFELLFKNKKAAKNFQ